ncbi:MAG: ADP-forming succinate--CoA ligase subunit beta [Acidimicrobiales bacterium]
MDLLEYEGKAYFARYGVPVTTGTLATTPGEAAHQAGAAGFPAVVKAQVLTGGRGKAGGIKVASSPSEAEEHARAILGMDIRGHTVHRVLIERATSIAQEYYASFTVERTARCYLAMVSARGGVDIEQVAADDPAAVARRHIGALDGFGPVEASGLAGDAGIDEAAQAGVAGLLVALYRCFREGDAELVEVNPLVLTTGGAVVALDAKVTLDSNAAFRHPEWQAFAATDVTDRRERLAREKGLQYVGLDGDVGVIANGAGLAMSTLDVVSQVGGRPANFLDIGGGASAEVMASGLEVVTADATVRSVLVNVFGGITKGEEVARGIIAALGRRELTVPVVVRLDGTNAGEGRALLAAHLSDRLQSRPTMAGAAKLAVELAREGA